MFRRSLLIDERLQLMPERVLFFMVKNSEK